METITNVASAAATTVSNLVYGQPAKDNETQGNEPVSGEQGKGTAAEPFDKGNSEDPITASTKTTESDDFLKLNPTVGKTAATDSAADVKTGTSNETSMPILPLNPDASTLGSATTTTSTGLTDKAGASETVWKPTALDEVKPSGAPGAGPEAPSDVKPAKPEGFDGAAASKKESTTETAETTKESKEDSADKKESHGTAQAQPSSISPEVDAVIKGEHPKTEHSVPEAEAEDPNAKMENKTKRAAEPSKPDTTGEEPVVESSSKKSTDKTGETTSPERSSSADKAEKDSKMSNLKDKLKTKLHIGSKDK